MEDHDQVRCFKLFFFFEFWGRANLCTFPIISLSLSLLKIVVSVIFFQRKRDFSFFNSSSSSLTPSALSSSHSSFIFYVNSDGTSYAQAMCSPKLNPLIVSGTDFLPSSRFFEKCGLAREGVPFAQSRARFLFLATKKPRGEVYPPIGFLFLFLSRALTPHRSFFLLFFSKQINCESTP